MQALWSSPGRTRMLPDAIVARRHPRPRVSLEFEFADVGAVAPGADDFRSRGYDLLHDARRDPWGQTVACLISPEGAVIGLCTLLRCTSSAN